MSEKLVKCVWCGNEIAEDEIEIVEGDFMCPDCFSDNVSSCEKCSKQILTDNSHYFSGEIYCDNCYDRYITSCRNCGEDIKKYDAREYNYDYYCEECFSELFTKCYECGEVISWDDVIEYNDDYYCDGCCPCELLHDSDYQPDLCFHKSTKDKRTKLYFGTEIELEEGCIESLSNYISDFFYLKEDASLDSGCETVTHPFTWNWYMENKNLFKEYFKKVQAYDFEAKCNCGMHVHLSKRAFSTKRLRNLLLLFYNNPEFIFSISGRKYESSLDEWAKLDFPEDIDNLCKGGHDGKYRAVNLNNYDTVEIRVFGSTTDFEEFDFKISFVKAAFDFCGKTSTNKTDEKDFLKFIRKNKTKYPALKSLGELIYA
jgi:formylmethanofuran dehydrogenase subunit E